LIFEFFSFETSEILKLQLISKSFSQIIPNLETLWEDISRQKWVYVSNSLKTKSWFHFFKKRFTTLLKSKNEQGDALPIEECAEWDFHCPSKFFEIFNTKVSIDSLKRTDVSFGMKTILFIKKEKSLKNLLKVF
jgi:hypothetical protein